MRVHLQEEFFSGSCESVSYQAGPSRNPSSSVSSDFSATSASYFNQAARPRLAPLVRAARPRLAPLVRGSRRSSTARAARPRLAPLARGSCSRRSPAAHPTRAARPRLAPWIIRCSIPLSGSATPFLAPRVRELDSVGTWFLAARMEKPQKGFVDK